MIRTIRMPGPLWLASRSPRRRDLLAEAGVAVQVALPAVDDGGMTPGPVSPEDWVIALAYLKARSAADALRARGVTGGTVLGADTLCVADGALLGQPVDEARARAMLHRLRGRAHVTMTGVCRLDLTTGERHMFVDRAVVRMGAIDDEAIEAYLRSGTWRGKAGAYNLADRIAAGWDVTCEGDPATVMGLPMRRLGPWLEELRP